MKTDQLISEEELLKKMEKLAYNSPSKLEQI